MDYPKYVRANGKLYNINTDFRVAIECNRIAEDTTINDYERALAIIYTLFGEEALNDFENHEKLLELAQKYLLCGKELETNNNEEKYMDFIQDMPYIEASFMSDFNMDLEHENMHWWKFMALMNGLSNSEFGNCCILNNIINLRRLDVSKIKDNKEKQKIIEAKKSVALKKEEKQFTEEQKKSIEKFCELVGL